MVLNELQIMQNVIIYNQVGTTDFENGKKMIAHYEKKKKKIHIICTYTTLIFMFYTAPLIYVSTSRPHKRDVKK